MWYIMFCLVWRSSHSLNTCFFYIQFSKIANSNYEDVRSWSRKAKIYHNGKICVRKIVFPINVNENHWVCVCVDTEKCEINYYNSLYNSRSSNENVIFDFIERFMNKDLKTNCNNMVPPKWIKRNLSLNSSQQSNCK